jgi:hypothetical protein
MQSLLGQRWTPIGVNLPEPSFTPEVIARLIRITSGNLRLLTRLLTQIERVLSINDAQAVYLEIVEAARDSLVIGHSGQQYPIAEAFEQEITTLYEAREQEREAKRVQSSLSPHRAPRASNLCLERFRTSIKYQDRPAAADIAFCVAAYANGMTEDRIERALEDDYLSGDPSASKRAAYIRRTIEKARRWVER